MNSKFQQFGFLSFSFIYTNCVQKVSRLKQYLPRQSWTMKETLIFFSKFKVRNVQKVLWLKLNLPRQKWTINESLIFFKLVPLAFNTQVFHQSKYLWNFSFNIVWSYTVIYLLMLSVSSNFTTEMNFWSRKWKTDTQR